MLCTSNRVILKLIIDLNNQHAAQQVEILYQNTKKTTANG